MRTEEKTDGEQLFETYLASQGLTDFDYEMEHEGKKRHPDYLVRMNDDEYIFDVKEFDPPDVIAEFAWYDPHPAIREKINQVSKQFREFKDKPCCLVLYNNGDPYVNLQDDTEMLGAMYGDFGIAWDVDVKTGQSVPNTERPIFGDKGKMIRPHWSNPQNTTISALITLRYVRVGALKYRKFLRFLREQSLLDDDSIQPDFDINEMHLGVIVWENVFARIPFPRTLFCGSYDERFGAEEEILTRVFAGEGVLAFEELEKELARRKTGV